ncbi:hypothetical protein GCM10025792_09420 [Pseudonocardia tropica]
MPLLNSFIFETVRGAVTSDETRMNRWDGRKSVSAATDCSRTRCETVPATGAPTAADPRHPGVRSGVPGRSGTRWTTV